MIFKKEAISLCEEYILSRIPNCVCLPKGFSKPNASGEDRLGCVWVKRMNKSRKP